MKKVFVKFVKGKKDERKESGGITPSQSGDLVSPARTPEEEGVLGLDNSSGYIVDFLGKDKTLTKLHKAAWQGNLEKLKTALKKVEVDAVDKHNRTALHFAVAQGHPNIVWFLLGNNANTSVCDDEGHTPLLKAIECGHKECMNLLLDRGSDVNVSDYTGNTGLHVAVGQGSLDTVAALLKKGADTEISNNAGDYPLHIATRLENKDLIDLLLGAGASVDVLDRENRTPLMLAAKTGNCVLARLFVQHGAQSTVVDSNGWTAQDYAMLGGHENVAASLKSFSKIVKTIEESKVEEPEPISNDKSGSWGDSQTEESDKELIVQKFKKFYEKDSEEKGMKSVEKDKNEESTESPDAEAIPPLCQPPKSWEMIQAGMIDENKSGNKPKRRSITILGMLRSRRESFTEDSVSSPEFTLSLNRRKGAKVNNAFAKQRLSFNEEESLKYWYKRQQLLQGELGITQNLNGAKSQEDKQVTADMETKTETETDWDSASEKKPVDQRSSTGTDTTESHEMGSRGSDSGQSGTLGRDGTMHEVEEIWVTNSRLSPPRTNREQQRNSWDSEDTTSEKEGNFPPPPSALELGVDMAKSIKYMKGMSVDQSFGSSLSTKPWKNFYDSHSLDCLEERDFIETSKGNGAKAHERHRSASVHRREEVFKCQKPRDRLVDVSRRISEQLECYDQALRELAESSNKKKDKPPHHNFYSLPCTKTGGGDFSQDSAPSASSLFLGSGPHSLPFWSGRPDVENNESLGSDRLPEPPPDDTSAKNPGNKTKRHMLLAMREVKHAVHLSNTFRTSTDDQILSPLTKPEESFDLDVKSSTKEFSSNSEGNSPPDENPFFGMGRQETVLERSDTGRKSSSSETGEESTLWLQDGEKRGKGARSSHSDDDVSEIAPDEGSKHKRVSSFSPLGIIQREMEEEGEGNRGKKSNRLDASALGLTSEEPFCGENEEPYREQSPDVSLSSGPIEPIGTEKDSGSEPESSHNDASPSQNYNLKRPHEWLKSHLKAATTEKNKLEELTVQLAEKAERLQYELADAKEAAKSRDEVIHLLQGQLARMEAAYTKSLEESVQSRLRLTSHEQEILHLKELCYRYEEEKEACATMTGGELLQESQLRIKTLEEEKEKMKKEIIHLEEEKSLLEKRLKQDKNEESEMIDQCQQWKERFGKLEEMANAYDSKQASYESYVQEKNREFVEEKNRLQHRNFQLEKKYLQLNEENIELKAKVQSLSAEIEAEKRKATAKDEKSEFIFELKKKNIQMETHVKNLEKEMEEKMVRKLKEKEEEIGALLKQFNRERDSLVASYEKKLAEGRSEQSLVAVGEWKKENQRLRQMVNSLQDQVERMQRSFSTDVAQTTSKNQTFHSEDEWGSSSVPIAEMQKDFCQLNDLVMENLKLRKEMNDMTGKVGKEGTESKQREPREIAQAKSEISELKNQVNSLRMLLDGERWPSTDREHRKSLEKRFDLKSEGKRKGVGKEDELAWSSLYGMKATRRGRGGRSTSVTEALIKANDVEGSSDEGKNDSKKPKPSDENILNRLNAAADQEAETSRKSQKLEFLQLKKEILSLQSKMSDEKNLRHALENQIIKINLDLRERENLEKEMNCLKNKVDRDCLRRSEMELLEYQKDLDAKREKYLGEPKGGSGDDNFKARCEILAKEREKSKDLRNSFGRRAKSFDSSAPQTSPQIKLRVQPRPHPEIFLQSRFVALDPDMKNKLETELDRSIRKYIHESSSTPSISNLQIEFVKKNYC